MLRKNPEIFAYKSIKKDFSGENDDLRKSLDKLIHIAKKLESPLLRELKPYAAFSLKWKFDYLTKTGEPPFLLQYDVNYWMDFFRSLKNLTGQNWFLLGKKVTEKNPWMRTRKAFNFMWPRNTDQKKQFETSLKMVELRSGQVISMLPGKTKWLKGKTVLDSGCGPGRYIQTLLKYRDKPKNIIGVDSGKEIIKKNKERFKVFPRVHFFVNSVDKLKFGDESFDFIISAGVLHHLKNPMEELIREHARVLKKGGYFFIFIAGGGGLELKMWEFLRNFLYDVDIEDMFKRFNGKISQLRLQGLLDHSYGEYQQTSRQTFERILAKYFAEIKPIPGIEGLDVTPEIYKNDIYFPYRFGSGNLRYLCQK